MNDTQPGDITVAPTKGVLYCSTSSTHMEYLKAAIASASSVRQFSPRLSIHIWTDQAGKRFIDQLSDSPFHTVDIIVNPHYRSKVDHMAKTPFDMTLYLDSDTRLCNDISDMFDILQQFDIAAAHAHRRNSSHTSQIWRNPIPAAFPQFNTGVILYRNSSAVATLLQSWQTAFHEANFKKDQVTFRELLWLTNLRVATLPPEYNIRYEKYLSTWTSEEATPQILHMRKFHEDLTANTHTPISTIYSKLKQRLSKLKSYLVAFASEKVQESK